MEQKLITKTLTVNGMTCANCENRIENNLKKINGIINVNVSYTRSQVKFTFDGNLVKLATIVDSIEKLDYKVVRSREKQKDAAISKNT